MDISNNLPEILNLLCSIKNDKERENVAEKIRDSHKQFLEKEASGRRIKSRSIIMDIAKIDRAIEEFEIQYNVLKESKNIIEIEALDKYIYDIKKYRRNLARKKNNLR